MLGSKLSIEGKYCSEADMLKIKREENRKNNN